MNGHDPEPLPNDVVDELLSAELDGEFDAAARDLGFEPAVAQARLDATAGVGARRAALDAVRAQVGRHDDVVLDELTRRRLVATAVTGASPADHHGHHRSRAWAVRVGAIAASAAVLAGLVVVLAKGSNSSGSKSSSVAAAPATPPTTTAPSAASDARSSGAPARVDTDAQLDAVVHGLLQSKEPAPSAADAVPLNTTSKATREQSNTKSSANYSSTPTASCTTRIADTLKTPPNTIATAPVQYHEARATVVVFQTARGAHAVVYESPSCRVLLSRLVK